jgi:hypothetical protein
MEPIDVFRLSPVELESKRAVYLDDERVPPTLEKKYWPDSITWQLPS